MHVEVSVALNFVISYLYNKLPRRRVDMLGTELETGLKKKFEGHWYPDKPFKGSGFRCVRVNGEQIDPVIIAAARNVGLDLEEMKEYLPAELTLWIDPNEVSYRIGEKGTVKILYSDRSAEENTEREDQEVLNTNRGFNPDAQSFNPDTLAQAFNPDAASFKPIDALSTSLGSLNISPSPRGLSPSPISSGSWGGSLSTSPSSGALLSPAPPTTNSALPYNKGGGGVHAAPMFTTATFAQTKFGSTKLKSNAKRPTRLSPTEFNTFLRQKTLPAAPSFSHPGLTSPTRSRSLSPRDPRVEFIMDQQQRLIHNQHQLQQYHQHQLQLQQQQQQLNFQLRQSQQQQFPQNQLNIPGGDRHHQRLAAATVGSHHHHQPALGSLHDMFSGPSPLQSPVQAPAQPGLPGGLHAVSPGFHSPAGGAVAAAGHLASHSARNSPLHSPGGSGTSLQVSPDNHAALLDGLTINNVPYSSSGQFHQLLLAS